jgi:drug/metabolite transporter (DMT)-like permease
MIGWVWRGERPGRAEWSGLALAMVGLVLPTNPSVSGSPLGQGLMLLAGGVGHLPPAGRATDPLRTTAANFVRPKPQVLVLVGISFGSSALTCSATG